MIAEKIDLNALYPAIPAAEAPALLHTFCRSASKELGGKNYPALLICPGGGYAFTSDREAEPVALAFLARGIQCFVLRYHVAPTHYPAQHLEVAASLHYIRENAARYQVNPDCVAVLGFSAGGHLAGSYATRWSDGLFCETLGVGKESLRPNAMALCYGVLSGGEKTHEGSMKNLLGDQDGPDMRRKLSTELNVTADTPPAFLWHTFADSAVPVENSLYVAEALAAHKIPFELHIYPDGGHGLALSNWLTTSVPDKGLPPKYVSHWVPDCADWLLRLAGLDYATAL